MPESNPDTSRYGIYFCPRSETHLHRLGSHWLGRDVTTCATLDPDLSDPIRREDWLRVTDTPRRYGFHATLKPPFRLAEGITVEDLQAALRDVARRHDRFETPRLGVRAIARFLALTLSEANEDLQRLAADSVSEFERFRAPSTELELAQRMTDSLSPRERAHVLLWGYPYVFDTWKFHMTLTSPLSPELIALFEPYLRDRFVSACEGPLLVDSICIVHQPSPEASFYLLDRVSLRSGS
jgi:putative phosphonate metabolism protein